MNRILKSLATAFAVAAGCIPTANAQDGCKPVNGRFEARVVPPGVGHCPNIAGLLCTAGRVWGGIQGQYQFVVSGVVPAATIGGIPTAIFFAGQSTILLKSGSPRTRPHNRAPGAPPRAGGFAPLITVGSRRSRPKQP